MTGWLVYVFVNPNQPTKAGTLLVWWNMLVGEVGTEKAPKTEVQIVKLT